MKMKITLILLIAFFLSSSWAISQENKLTVIVDKASIYAESSTSSYRIETIKRGTDLSLFNAKQSDKNWFYIYYQSPRWNSKVTGFIQAEMVEEYSEAHKDELAFSGLNKGKGRIEKTLEPTVPQTHKAFSYPLSSSVVQNPRFYDVITKEKSEPKILSARESHVIQAKDKINTKLWLEKVVIPEKTEITKKEYDIKKADLLEKTALSTKKEPQIVSQDPPKITRLHPPRRRSLFTLSLGYGPSLGGFGGFIQLNASRNLSLHFGFGYYPTSVYYPDYDWVKGKLLYSVGIKYYLPWRTDQVRPYVDFQYGKLSVEAVRIVTGFWHYSCIYEDIQKTLMGPSLLAGIELRMGSFGLNGALGASYVITKWEYWDQPLFLTADVGFLLHF